MLLTWGDTQGPTDHIESIILFLAGCYMQNAGCEQLYMAAMPNVSHACTDTMCAWQ